MWKLYLGIEPPKAFFADKCAKAKFFGSLNLQKFEFVIEAETL